MHKKSFLKIIIPILYTAAILALVLYQWDKQQIIRHGESNPVYRNLMEYPAYVRHGFDIKEIREIQDR